VAALHASDFLVFQQTFFRDVFIGEDPSRSARRLQSDERRVLCGLSGLCDEVFFGIHLRACASAASSWANEAAR
jgi:hypothetical protein